MKELGRNDRREFVWRARDKRLILGRRTAIVGVVNVTPDSFSDGGLYLAPEAAVDRGLQLLEDGADCLDLGAESSRPGADPTPLDEEMRRLAPVIESIRPLTAAPLMVDTYKSEVARRVLELGVDAVNDISAFRMDPEMAGVVADFEAGVVLMHMRGTPRTMQEIAPSEDILQDIDESFEDALRQTERHGIAPESVILDPGIGFGKTVDDNLKIINRLERFGRFDVPLLVGPSRKSFIGAVLGVPVEERIWGTAAAVAAAALRGAHLVRVHDVAEMKDVLTLADSIASEGRVE